MPPHAPRPQAKRQATELSESSKTLKLNLEKLTRVQHEMLQRSRKADEATREWLDAARYGKA